MNIRILAMAMAGLLCAGLAAQAQPRTAVAEIRGCTDATITGRAQLSEIPSQEGVKQVLVELTVSGLPDGQHTACTFIRRPTASPVPRLEGTSIPALRATPPSTPTILSTPAT
jgi:hypothetical protein